MQDDKQTTGEGKEGNALKILKNRNTATWLRLITCDKAGKRAKLRALTQNTDYQSKTGNTRQTQT